LIFKILFVFILFFYCFVAIVVTLSQEKGNGALHIATQANQSSQVELLLVYGADPGSFDAHGRTPADIARFELCSPPVFYLATVHVVLWYDAYMLPPVFQ